MKNVKNVKNTATPAPEDTPLAPQSTHGTAKTDLPPPEPTSQSKEVKPPEPVTQSKFRVGEHVDHPGARDGTFPLGTGTISQIHPDGNYSVKSDGSGLVLSQQFTASELHHR